MALEFSVSIESLAAVRTQARSSVAVHTTLVSLQVTRVVETLVTQRTDVCPLSRVHSHMHRELTRLSERLVAHEAAVRSLFTVNSPVLYELMRPCKSFATDGALKRFLSGVTPRVCSEFSVARTTSATRWALVSTRVNVHMMAQRVLR